MTSPERQVGGQAGTGPLALLERGGFVAPAINDYDPIAPAFDEVMGFDFHDATHQIRERAVGGLARDGHISCIDLCAGTGLFLDRLSTRFVVQGLGVDLSAGQSAVARMRGVANGQVEIIVGNVLDQELPFGVDLVTINFDALNHLTDAQKWKRVLSKAHAALRPGGMLLFDINLPDRLANDWDAPEVIVKERVTYIQLSHPSAWSGTTIRRRTPMIIFQQAQDGGFLRLDALIEQFAMPLEEVLGLLTTVGFAESTVLQEGDPRPRGHIFNKNRAFISARR